ncbi:MAG TPA: hypothetical protein VKU41_23060 [Polyangiaceae bacterium]|nr:hypothetical protein [Polyangiaceae bacterium]
MAVGGSLSACSTGEPDAPAADPTSHRDAFAPDSTAGQASSSADDAGADATSDAATASLDGDEEDAGSATDPTDAGGWADAPASFLAAQSVIQTSCTFVRCHGGPFMLAAGLWFDPYGSIRGPLVNVPACEYDRMMRVTPGDPANSWMVVKLTALQDPVTHAIEFSPEAGWAPVASCGLDPGDAGGRFGLRMPETDNYQLDPTSLAQLIDWIEAGAPGPN